MATYVVTAPDGQEYEVTAPEGATEADVLDYARRNYRAAGGSGQSGQLGQASRKTYPEEQLGAALRKAHAAGHTSGAKALADQIRWQRSQAQGGIPKRGTTVKLSQLQGAPGRQGTVKLSQVMAQSRRPDFSNVQGGVTFGPGVSRRDPLEVRAISGDGRPYTGPLLADNGTPGLDTTDSTLAARAELDRRMALPRLTPEQAKQRAFRELPAPVRGLIGVGSSVGRLGRGVGQLYAMAADAVAPEERTLSSLITGAPSSRTERAMEAEREARMRDSYMQGDLAASVGSVAGDVGLTLAPGGAVARTLGTTGRAALAGNAALGAGYAALQPVVQGESRANNTSVGAAFGAGGQLAGDALGYVGRRAAQSVPDATQAMARRAMAMGIPLHASQVSDSLPVKVAASAGKYLPFSGYAGAAKRQQEGFNRAVGQTFGVDAPKITDDVMRDARQAMSRQFEEIYGRNAVPITEKAARRLAEIEREASRRLTNDEAQVLRNQLDDILANAEDGVFTGQKYQAVRTALKKAEDQTKLGQAVRDMRMALDDLAADSVGPQDAAALKKLRSQWANFRTVENARKQNAGASDDIRPGSLWPLIRKGSTQEMRELARMGQTILKDPIADSGTAQRSLIYNVLMGGGSIANPALIPMIGKAALGGATLGRAANSNKLAQLLVRENRGVPTTKLAKLLQNANPRVMPAAGAAYNRPGLEFDVTGGRRISDEEFEREYGFRP